MPDFNLFCPSSFPAVSGLPAVDSTSTLFIYEAFFTALVEQSAVQNASTIESVHSETG